MATFVSEMQAINPSTVQAIQQQVSSYMASTQNTQPQQTAAQPPKTQTVTVSQQPQTQTTIIQPANAHSGQQFIVTISGDQAAEQQSAENVQLQQNSNPTTVYPHVQQNYSDYSQATMYTQVSGSYYQTAQGGAQMASITPVGSLQGQILTHQGGTYLVSGGTMDGEGHPIAHTTRASPATVQWLVDNFEGCEGVSLPRCTLYNLYLRHCSDTRLDAINPASFGKLVRSVFLGLRTRRLGTRGNSKYHYYGIRIKATSPLNQYTDDQTMAMRQQPINQGKRFRPANVKTDGSEDEGSVTPTNAAADAAATQQHQHQQFLGDASAAIPNFGSIDITDQTLPEGISLEHLQLFEHMYKEHCEGILDVVVNLQFSLIEQLWQSFWRNSQVDQHSTDSDYEKRLPKDKLFVMCKMEGVQNYVRQSDYAFYQALVEVLIPDVLRPIPSSLTQAIRNFAKSLENWLKNSMTEVHEEMVKTKIGAVSAFAQTLRRYTSLNHLAQAARAVLQNTSQINQMLTDLNRVDFANVQEQASWVCQCEDAVVTQLEQDFKKTLQQQNSLEQWAIWLESVVNQVLKPHEGSPNFPKAARQFLLKWSFYSSMVIRDLTLRSAASFGSFHLIRLLYDEYMFYLIEHKVAAATGETPIAVMGEFIDLGNVMAMGTLEMEPSMSSATSSPSSIILNSSTAVTVNAAAPTQKMVNNIGGAPAIPTAAPAQPMGTPTPNATTVTVVAAGAPGAPGAKTIVVVPVSSHGSGDAQPAVKRLKPN